MPFEQVLADSAALRSRYRSPKSGAVDKLIHRVDDAARSFIAQSPFVVISTASDAGCDVSPRGGPPGFVKVLDDHRLAFGDLAGNNRLDSFSNLVVNPHIAVLFLVPGVDETLRVNGRATLTTDPDVVDLTAIDGRRPRVAVGVEVEECYLHCGKAFRRSGLWDPQTWPTAEERPDPMCLLRDHLAIDVDPELIRTALEADYEATLWVAGGDGDGGP
jgi:uncharacterized protein